MKTAIIVMSDPSAGFDEALCRVCNTRAAAFDFKSSGRRTSGHEQNSHSVS
jgi:hypothetical protein